MTYQPRPYKAMLLFLLILCLSCDQEQTIDCGSFFKSTDLNSIRRDDTSDFKKLCSRKDQESEVAWQPSEKQLEEQDPVILSEDSAPLRSTAAVASFNFEARFNPQQLLSVASFLPGALYYGMPGLHHLAPDLEPPNQWPLNLPLSALPQLGESQDLVYLENTVATWQPQGRLAVFTKGSKIHLRGVNHRSSFQPSMDNETMESLWVAPDPQNSAFSYAAVGGGSLEIGLKNGDTIELNPSQLNPLDSGPIKSIQILGSSLDNPRPFHKGQLPTLLASLITPEDHRYLLMIRYHEQLNRVNLSPQKLPKAFGTNLKPLISLGDCVVSWNVDSNQVLYLSINGDRWTEIEGAFVDQLQRISQRGSGLLASDRLGRIFQINYPALHHHCLASLGFTEPVTTSGWWQRQNLFDHEIDWRQLWLDPFGQIWRQTSRGFQVLGDHEAGFLTLAVHSGMLYIAEPDHWPALELIDDQGRVLSAAQTRTDMNELFTSSGSSTISLRFGLGPFLSDVTLHRQQFLTSQ